MPKLSKETQMYIVMGVIVAVLMYVYIAILYLPLMKKVSESAAALERKTNELASAREVEKQYEQSKYKESQLIKKQEILNRRIGERMDLALMFEEVEEVMALTNTYYTILTVPTPPKIYKNPQSKEIKAYAMDITMRTTYNDFCTLLSQLSTITKPVAFYVLSVKYVGELFGRQNLEVKVTLLAYEIEVTKEGAK